MSQQFSPSACASLPDGEQRSVAAARAAELGPPSSETEEWRYSPIGDLGLDGLAPVVTAPGSAGTVPDLATGDRAATVTVVDGWVVDVAMGPGWAEKGLDIVTAPVAALPATGEETLFDLLHQAFCPAALLIRAPTGLTVRDPIVIRTHHATGGAASFPRVVVEAGDGADLVVVDHQTSADGTGLSVPVTELRVGPSARVRHQVVQDLGRDHWQLGRQYSTVASQATLAAAVASFGGRYARLRVDSRLAGRGASANLVAAYYGDGDQIHDFRVFQHHDARNTRSDLLFKGAQDARSGSVYTGLIHIHPDGGGSNAFQTNRNIKLSPDAWAWSVPNLEIENNDVRCSHASTVSPVDDDQRFYLQARGVPPVAADRLIVAGFFDEVIERLPVDALRQEVRRLIAAKLDQRTGDRKAAA